MNTMQTVVLIAHTFIAVMIIVLVLMQRGKGADAGAAFGAGASGTVFGARGSSNFFSRATAVLAAAFFASSLTLAFMSSQRVDAPQSLIEGAPLIEDEEERTQDEDASLPDLPPLEEEQEPAASEDMPPLPDDTPADPDETGQSGGDPQ
jgi:preprotein translocase subunit SecG